MRLKKPPDTANTKTDVKKQYMKLPAVKERREIENLINNRQYEGVRELKYLGSTVNNTNKGSKEIHKRVTSGNIIYYMFRTIFTSKLIRRGTKLLFYKTLVQPIVKYASETWALHNNDVNA